MNTRHLSCHAVVVKGDWKSFILYMMLGIVVILVFQVYKVLCEQDNLGANGIRVQERIGSINRDTIEAIVSTNRDTIEAIGQGTREQEHTQETDLPNDFENHNRWVCADISMSGWAHTCEYGYIHEYADKNSIYAKNHVNKNVNTNTHTNTHTNVDIDNMQHTRINAKEKENRNVNRNVYTDSNDLTNVRETKNGGHTTESIQCHTVRSILRLLEQSSFVSPFTHNYVYENIIHEAIPSGIRSTQDTEITSSHHSSTSSHESPVDEIHTEIQGKNCTLSLPKRRLQRSLAEFFSSRENLETNMEQWMLRDLKALDSMRRELAEWYHVKGLNHSVENDLSSDKALPIQAFFSTLKFPEDFVSEIPSVMDFQLGSIPASVFDNHNVALHKWIEWGILESNSITSENGIPNSKSSTPRAEDPMKSEEESEEVVLVHIDSHPDLGLGKGFIWDMLSHRKAEQSPQTLQSSSSHQPQNPSHFSHNFVPNHHQWLLDHIQIADFILPTAFLGKIHKIVWIATNESQQIDSGLHWITVGIYKDTSRTNQLEKKSVPSSHESTLTHSSDPSSHDSSHATQSTQDKFHYRLGVKSDLPYYQAFRIPPHTELEYQREIPLLVEKVNVNQLFPSFMRTNEKDPVKRTEERENHEGDAVNSNIRGSSWLQSINRIISFMKTSNRLLKSQPNLSTSSQSKESYDKSSQPRYILDIDLDFFSTIHPFLQVIKDVNTPTLKQVFSLILDPKSYCPPRDQEMKGINERNKAKARNNTTVEVKSNRMKISDKESLEDEHSKESISSEYGEVKPPRNEKKLKQDNSKDENRNRHTKRKSIMQQMEHLRSNFKKSMQEVDPSRKRGENLRDRMNRMRTDEKGLDERQRKSKQRHVKRKRQSIWKSKKDRKEKQNSKDRNVKWNRKEDTLATSKQDKDSGVKQSSIQSNDANTPSFHQQIALTWAQVLRFCMEFSHPPGMSTAVSRKPFHTTNIRDNMDATTDRTTHQIIQNSIGKTIDEFIKIIQPITDHWCYGKQNATFTLLELYDAMVAMETLPGTCNGLFFSKLPFFLLPFEKPSQMDSEEKLSPDMRSHDIHSHESTPVSQSTRAASIHDMIKEMELLIGHLKMLGNPLGITIARSVIDHYTPMDRWVMIEKALVSMLHRMFVSEK